MTTWRLIRSGYQSGALNMALDDALLRSVSAGAPPVLRLYRWRPATLTIGYAQSAATDVNLAVCRDAGLDLVRRPTGGRAVLHDEEVTYAVIAPDLAAPFGGSVVACYRTIADTLLHTVTGFGIDAHLVPGRPKGGRANPVRAVCFSAPSQYELVVDRCKIAGSAQKRTAGAFLQHGSLPLELDLELLARLLPGERGQQDLQSIGWLNRWAERPLAVGEVEDAFVTSFRDCLGVPLHDDQPTDQEMIAATSLADSKYGTEQWNLCR